MSELYQSSVDYFPELPMLYGEFADFAESCIKAYAVNLDGDYDPDPHLLGPIGRYCRI
jgi:hypothetical protein